MEKNIFKALSKLHYVGPCVLLAEAMDMWVFEMEAMRVLCFVNYLHLQFFGFISVGADVRNESVLCLNVRCPSNRTMLLGSAYVQTPQDELVV